VDHTDKLSNKEAKEKEKEKKKRGEEHELAGWAGHMHQEATGPAGQTARI
jgi:hypothetical protein